MKKGYILNIETTTKENTDYRRVLYTSTHLQLVLMCIAPGDAIGEEVHHLDQFIRIEEGDAAVRIGETTHTLHADSAFVIPEGTIHNVTNVGTIPLKLYTIYAPPEHKDQTLQRTKADEKEEHFDGVTTE